MTKQPLTFEEKVAARYTRGARHQCWIWDGGVNRGRPSLNLRHVGRFIYEQEFGPIPKGYVLTRIDHDDTCKPLLRSCRHMFCVNPYHVILDGRMGEWGTYEREKGEDYDDNVEPAIRARRRKRARQNVGERNPEGQSFDRTPGGTE
jgi:hypothetical protein